MHPDRNLCCFHIYAYVHIRIYIYTYTPLTSYTSVYVSKICMTCTRTYIYIYLWYLSNLFMCQTYVNTYIYIYIHTYIYTSDMLHISISVKHMYIQIYICPYIHIYIPLTSYTSVCTQIYKPQTTPSFTSRIWFIRVRKDTITREGLETMRKIPRFIGLFPQRVLDL